MLNHRLRIAGVLLVSALMAACANRPPSLYQWQRYQSNVDAYFRGDKLSLDAQTQLMEEDLKKIQASGALVPPGYYAHLGLLYGQQGNLDNFAQYLQAERKQYPESEVFVSFLLRNFKKK